jgi:hypothetical protein
MNHKRLETMISLVSSNCEIKSNLDLIQKIKEEFNVSVTLADIFALDFDEQELDIENKKLEAYERYI